MGRLVHFEIHAEDMERTKKFYGEVFGWTFEDWSEYAGMPYFGAVTGDASQPGIDGALIKRQGAAPEPGQAVNGYACTLGTDVSNGIWAGGITPLLIGIPATSR